MEVNDHIDDHILAMYKIIQKIGKGAYGIVWKALKKDTNEVVALKKIFDAFRNSTDAQRTYREIMFLQKLKKCPNIVKLMHVYPADNNRDVYLVFEYVETDLHAVIRSNILEDVHKKYILYQLLKSIHFIHTGELLHRDLKPSNILLNSKCAIKLADFGLARSVAPNNNTMAKDLNQSISKTLVKDKGNTETEKDIVMTDYVATRWYRAPEILVGSTKYTKGVDMWAIGCIFGEMLMGKPLFPGSSTINQLGKVITFTGMPSESDMDSLGSPFTKVMITSLGNIEKKPMREYFPKAEEEALDLLTSLLQFNPNKRITTVNALNHPYLAAFHKSNILPSLTRAISIPVCDNIKYDLINYRHLIYKFIQHSNAGGGQKGNNGTSTSSSATSNTSHNQYVPSTISINSHNSIGSTHSNVNNSRNNVNNNGNGNSGVGVAGMAGNIVQTNSAGMVKTNSVKGAVYSNGGNSNGEDNYSANVRYYSINDEDQNMVNRRIYTNTMPALQGQNAGNNSNMAGLATTMGTTIHKTVGMGGNGNMKSSAGSNKSEKHRLSIEHMKSKKGSVLKPVPQNYAKHGYMGHGNGGNNYQGNGGSFGGNNASNGGYNGNNYQGNGGYMGQGYGSYDYSNGGNLMNEYISYDYTKGANMGVNMGQGYATYDYSNGGSMVGMNGGANMVGMNTGANLGANMVGLSGDNGGASLANATGGSHVYKEGKMNSIFPLCKFVPKKQDPYPRTNSMKSFYRRNEGGHRRRAGNKGGLVSEVELQGSVKRPREDGETWTIMTQRQSNTCNIA
ncbi:protein kinase [Theileria orientalis strain Shintoku]|uniref:Mitogen-activated protein kinase n=1 Tax=Theileria orientalis strain Shintoku TaxID=869250 RepID=J4DNM3_THEOR|nr:protein kinase [Theileria orientalis strain Shintoku]BAM39209.1 protein kinase [Theileria orientalis strain Shintoku]|eukprot:XP_009689510.1 protein kinase [Theileria orientalis strain Shintoku]